MVPVSTNIATRKLQKRNCSQMFEKTRESITVLHLSLKLLGQHATRF